MRSVDILPETSTETTPLPPLPIQQGGGRKSSQSWYGMKADAYSWQRRYAGAGTY